MKQPFPWFISFVLCLSSCAGYRFGHGDLVAPYRTICIPYVEGDNRGQLTTSLIRTFATHGNLKPSTAGAELALEVCLMEPEDENIGFGIAPPQDGDDTKILVSNEARLTVTALVTLIDRASGCRLLGPMEVSAWLDFDFEPDLGNVNEHAFSLGQLEMHPLARDGALPALYDRLAQRIADSVLHSW